MHLKIVCQGNRYILGQFSKPFNTVPEMIHYYSLNKLNIRGAEHKKLLHPVVPPPEYFTLEPGGYPTASWESHSCIISWRPLWVEKLSWQALESQSAEISVLK